MTIINRIRHMKKSYLNSFLALLYYPKLWFTNLSFIKETGKLMSESMCLPPNGELQMTLEDPRVFANNACSMKKAHALLTRTPAWPQSLKPRHRASTPGQTGKHKIISP